MARRGTAADQEDARQNTEDGYLSPYGKRRDWLAPFASLRIRNFRIFTIGSLISFTALQMQTLAQNYLVYQLTGLAASIGYVNAALGFSMLFTSLAGGIAADRMSKRRLMIIGQLIIGAGALFIGVMVTMRLIQVWHIIVAAVLSGVTAGFTMPARQSYVPDLVGEEKLMNALALSAGIMNITRIAGPALAGILIGMFGVGPIYYLKFVAYGIFVVFLLMIPVTGEPLQSKLRSPLADATEGARYLRRDRTVLELMVVAMVPVVLAMPFINFLPVFQEDIFHVGPSELGIMMAAVGGGAVAGALFIASLGDYQHKGRILLGSALGFGATLVLFNIVASAANFPLALVMLALVGATSTGYMALNNALVLTVTPPEMRGRMMGLFMTTFGLTSAGSVPIGVLVDKFGAPVTMGALGALVLVFFILVTLFRPSIRRL